MKRYIGIILIIFCGVLSLPQAQETPIWQAGDSIRSTLFDVQRLLFSVGRADNPAEVYAEAQIRLQDSLQVYTSQLQPTASQYAPDANAAVLDAFSAADEALTAESPIAFASARGRIWTNLLWVSYDVVQHTDDPAMAQAWLALREYRQATSVTLVDNPASRALQNADLSADEALVIVGNDLRDAYYFRLRDALTELESAVVDGYATRAAEWAGQSQGYFNILASDYAAKLGDAESVISALRLLEAAIIAEDWEQSTIHLDEIRQLLSAYQPVELSPDLIAERGRLLYLFLDLIAVEYRDGVRDGEITIPIEYQEATTFLAQASSIYEELRPVIASTDAASAERLDVLLAEINMHMTNLDEFATVESAVNESLELIESSLAIQTQTDDITATFTIVDTLLSEIIVAVADGRYTEAERARIEAYGLFESGPELRLANRAPVLSREIEGLFWEGSGGQEGLATLLTTEASVAEVTAAIEQVQIKLDEAQTFLGDTLTAPLAAVNSAIIIIREGLEAVLIIGAILAYMFKTGTNKRFIAWVFAGVAAAIALSILTWFAAQTFLTITPVQRELIEGVTSLIAVGVLFYVTNWLFHKVYVVDWMQYVREQADKALNNGHAFGLAMLGFMVVYREGLETVLFYQALLFDAEATPVLFGFIVGLCLILAIAYLILRLSKRIPLKPLFTATTILLLVLAFSFTGSGIRELQEAGAVSVTLLPWFPENLLLMELFGLFPTLETILAQVIFTVLIALTFMMSRWQSQPKPQEVR